MNIIRISLIAVVLASVSVFGAIAQSETAEPGAQNSLSGTTWLLTFTSGDDHLTSVLPQSMITLSFEDGGRVSGNGGCNGYSGTYTLGEQGQIALSEIVSTLRACADEQMTIQESIYLSALNGVTHYELNGRQLTLRIADVEALHFVSADQDPLVNTAWTLFTSDVQDVEATPEAGLDANAPTLEFLADNQAAGTGGCNRYSTTYTLDGANITFGQIASTRMACEGLMEQEQAFFDTLATAQRYGMTGDRLYIWSEDGRPLTFVKVELAQLVVTPLSGAPGTEVEVSGMGFAPNSEIVIGFGPFEGDVYTPVAEVQSDTDGAFTATVTLPADADPSVEWVFMAAVPGTARTLSEPFTVTGG